MSYETNDKMVSHPDHYKSGKYEVIDIIDEFTKDLSGTEAVCTANAIKYILRWKKKNGIQDVKKAIWYLQHMVDKEEKEDPEVVLTCKECGYYNPVCCFTGNNVKPDQLMCACFEEKGEEVLVPDANKVKEFYDTAGKNCKTCKHENDTCSDECTYSNPVDWEPKEEPTCSDCTFYEKGNCKFLNMHTMSDHVACGYLDLKTKENEVDMDKIMNRPTEEKKKKFINNTGEELNIPEFLEQPTDDSKDKQECEYIANLIKNYMNSQKVPTKPLKSMKEICEDIIAPKEPVKIEQSADEEIHSCDDCVFKGNEPWDDPCQSCDLHSNPPSKWKSES